jgi:hypothetical protein
MLLMPTLRDASWRVMLPLPLSHSAGGGGDALSLPLLLLPPPAMSRRDASMLERSAWTCSELNVA